ncbi:GAF and ANTAR domain-containing protein [Aeromicrobium wangtongii]|uniref:GAF and ANTAR domain-containing protein n=1 Tax=Aeromicrobium wangtongii TaxID=2969247 RepID=A0ABY5MA34_9ACTN|nr:GAF and ANTAR domain-containing protein [Aeromicrobium wangtongii]MCD9199660.1 GAF and ANTAR domain-containing protein [Aeromicrobium wangtongii]UUP14011.1 GAF and ANTAR domain-containing protein [Aeromicrobium wangtongii]
MHRDYSGDQYARIARALSNELGVAQTHDSATRTALQIVEGCDHAGISLVSKRGKITTVGPTDDIAVRADQLQYETGEGPCLQSIREQDTVYSPDLSSEERWPRWAPEVASSLGIRSALSLQLFVGPDAMGCLNLYADEPQAFGLDDRVSAHALAAHIAVAMTAAADQANMDSALVNRTMIGQAEGMLMQALQISGDQAFAAMVRISQHRNVKVSRVAEEIVKKGIHPDLFD